MPEVVPMESKLQTPEIAHNISFFFLISSCWNRCQLPFGWFPVLLGIHGVDGERCCIHPELSVAECDVLQAHIAPVCPHWTTKAASQGTGKTGK